MRESEVENHLVTLAERHGDDIRKTRWIGRNNAPDRFLMSKRKGVWLIEMKRPGKEPNEAQYREIERINKYRGLTFGGAIWLNNIEDVDLFYGMEG